MNKQKQQAVSLSNHGLDTSSDWTDWLVSVEAYLNAQGYRRYKQDYKDETFSYWKTFTHKGKDAYQVGLLFYDFRQFLHRSKDANHISIQYDCMLLGDNRIELAVSMRIELFDFEDMAREFYLTMVKYKK